MKAFLYACVVSFGLLHLSQVHPEPSKPAAQLMHR